MNLELKYIQIKKGGKATLEINPPPTTHSCFQWFDKDYGAYSKILQELIMFANKFNNLYNKCFNNDGPVSGVR